MTSPNVEHGTEDGSDEEIAKVESKETYAGLQSSLKEIKESLERLTRSVGELNSKLRSTGDTLKWVLDALSQRSEEKETLYLKNLEASTELLRNFMAFIGSRVKPVGKEAVSEAKVSKKETSAREAASTSKKEEEHLVRPSMVRKFQEEEGKDKDRKSR